jgi:hypothetical protein
MNRFVLFAGMLSLALLAMHAAEALDSRGTFLAIDSSVFESTEGLSLSLMEARKFSGNPVLKNRPEGPDAWRAGFPWVVMDGGRFRMWYMGRDAAGEYFTCYAESRDGYHWERPELGLFEHRGSKANNICYPGHALMTTVYLDPAATDPAKRYIGVMYGQITEEHLNDEQRRQYGKTQPSVKGIAFSPDGLRWQVAEQPLFPIPAKVEGGTLLRMNNRWILVHQQNAGEFPEVNRGSRFLRTSSSDNLIDWQLDNHPAFFFDPRFRGAIQTHVTPGYLNYGNVAVAAQGILYDNEELIDHETDLTLLLTNDGQQWRQPKPNQPLSYLLRRGDRESWDRSFVVQGNFVNNGDKTLLYYNGSQWGNVDTDGIQIGVAELSLDGYGSLAPKIGWDFGKPGPFSGTAVTRPIRLHKAGLRLYLNLRGGMADGDSVRAALLTAEGRAIPGFGFDDCEPINATSPGHPVNWQGGKTLDSLSDTAVKVAVKIVAHNPQRTGKARVQEPQFFALYFEEPNLFLGKTHRVWPGGIERLHFSDPDLPKLAGVDLQAKGSAQARVLEVTSEVAQLALEGQAEVWLSGPVIGAVAVDGREMAKSTRGWRLALEGAKHVTLRLQPATPPQ